MYVAKVLKLSKHRGLRKSSLYLYDTSAYVYGSNGTIRKIHFRLIFACTTIFSVEEYINYHCRFSERRSSQRNSVILDSCLILSGRTDFGCVKNRGPRCTYDVQGLSSRHRGTPFHSVHSRGTMYLRSGYLLYLFFVLSTVEQSTSKQKSICDTR